MDINLIKTFLEIYRTRHFGQTAENLFITQSTVSARIQLLETQLDTKLFYRTRNDIQLTHAGARFLPYAETILTNWNRAKQEVNLKEDNRKLLTIGMQNNLWSQCLCDWVKQIGQKFSHINCLINSESCEILSEQLIQGKLDLAIMLDPPQEQGLIINPISEFTLVMVSSDKSITADDCFSQKYLFVDWGKGFSVAHAINFPQIPPPFMQTQDANIALNLILNDKITAFLSENQLDKIETRDRLFEVPKIPKIKRTIYSAYSENNPQHQLIGDTLNNINKRKSDKKIGRDEKMLANID